MIDAPWEMTGDPLREASPRLVLPLNHEELPDATGDARLQHVAEPGGNMHQNIPLEVCGCLRLSRGFYFMTKAGGHYPETKTSAACRRDFTAPGESYVCLPGLIIACFPHNHLLHEGKRVPEGWMESVMRTQRERERFLYR